MVLMQKEKRQAGQTLLIVVLVMVISLTVGLSIASKTITNLRTTTEEADSAKALSAAETGIAQSIKSGATGTITGGFASNNTAFNSTLTSVSGTSFLVNAGNVIPQDEGADVWLIEHNASGGLIYTSRWNGTLTIYWGNSLGDCNDPSKVPAALEIIKITGTSASTAIATRYGYDPCSRSNNFASPTSSPAEGVVAPGTGKRFYYTANMGGPITDGLLVRVIPLYANTVLAVAGTAVLPKQGSIITSAGTSSNVVRKISVVANYYSLPSQFFTYGLFVPK
ncbi:hypothetical protein A3F03_00710 [Candidatus Roizmanbacteria bacterium RIFCSPHIGHO2_12_FULL_41_11]|uniref:Type 4 fimbrial biogenesis protein PilX N-terminal domain-containing protein n=1 Tax=Candidatus Roizmanbacteria bacterium RIFCSPHIGHO2_12_FULL_41_11 TaxID=1802052 RepID=A0A1F7I0E7_9BACT|nr:MAG: hypothetical protein A3F03_00710 [Candidatus Roizmanbacteria bacterium RIFCSPHIGHO2_12_FULL_41_11]